MSESDARVRRSLTEAELEAWKRIPTAVLSDEGAHAGVMMGIRPRFEGRAFAGQALTIEVQSVDDTPPREVLSQVPPGACIVIDARATPAVDISASVGRIVEYPEHSTVPRRVGRRPCCMK